LSRYGKAEPLPKGTALTVIFELEGQRFMVLNGGPYFKFTEAISLSVSCDTQTELDDLWEKLSAGGEKGQCGWLKDKFGLSWQIVPSGRGGSHAHEQTRNRCFEAGLRRRGFGAGHDRLNASIVSVVSGNAFQST